MNIYIEKKLIIMQAIITKTNHRDGRVWGRGLAVGCYSKYIM